MTVHVVWSTKYRYPVLTSDIKKVYRSLLLQVCDAEGVSILKGIVSNDHVHMHIEYRPSQNISSLVKRLQQEFPKLNERYWGRHFWAIEFGCWSTRNITDKMVNEYLEHHRKFDNDTDTFILE